MSLITLLFAPVRAWALEPRFIVVTTGIRIPFTQVVGNLINFLAVSSVSVCTLLFVIGAGQLVISHGDQTAVDNGKKMMISALIGMAITMSAYAIIRTLLFFLYEGS